MRARSMRIKQVLNDFIGWLNRSIVGYASPLELAITPLVLCAWLVLTWLWIEARRDRRANQQDYRTRQPRGNAMAFRLRDVAARDAINGARARWFALLFLLVLCVASLFTPDGVRQQVQMFFVLFELFSLLVTAMLFYSAIYSFQSRRQLGELIRSGRRSDEHAG